MFRIPMPRLSGEILNEGVENLMQRLLKEKQLGQEQYYKQQGLDIEKQKLPLQLDLLKAQAEANRGLAQQRQFGTTGGGVDFKNYTALVRQAMIDNPGSDMNKANQIVSAWLEGSPTLSDGSPTPDMSGSAKQLMTNVQRKNAPAQIQNQAANMAVLAKDVNDIDIAPAMHFAGLPGKLEYASNVAKMASGQEVSQEFRDYVSFKNVTSNFAMDALRKGFGTSVVPDYVYATLGKASQPNSTWWFDPKQVLNDWNKTKEWINSNAKHYRKLALRGLGAEETETPETTNKESKNLSTKSSNIITVVDPNGGEHKIYANQFEAAKIKYPGLKRKGS